MTRIAVIGAGSWGTALAQVLSGNLDTTVTLWARDAALAGVLRDERRNPSYLSEVRLRDAVEVVDDLGVALEGTEVAILAVPTHGMRAIAQRCRDCLPSTCAVVSAAKGFEGGTGCTMTAVLMAVLGEERAIAALSGPNIAAEVGAGRPAATVVASADDGVAATVRDLCNGTQLRVYSSADPVGVEYGGALKNVVAIAAGIADGLGVGDNAKAAVVTRGLAEMTRLGVRAGATPLTFAGLTGIGDCMVTCTSPHSRNRAVGEAIGKGSTLSEATAGILTVAEGVTTAPVARDLARRLGVQTPLVDQVCAVLFEGRPVLEAAAALLHRDARDELSELGFERRAGG